MKSNSIFGIALLVLGCAVFSSCKKDETPDSPAPIVENRVIEAKVVLDNVWTEEEPTKDGEQNSSIFMCYLFDPNGVCIRNRGGNMDDDMTVQFEDATTAGTHSIYAVTGWHVGEYPGTTSGPIDLTTSLPLAPNRIISLGCTTFTIVNGTRDYSVQVATNYIMAQLALTIYSVPSHINSIRIELPNQGDSFKFTGIVEGNTQSKTLNLTRSQTANENGSYDWTLTETIIPPSATNATSMPITVTATSTLDSTRTIETTTSACCTAGTRKHLRTTWDAFFNTATVTINPWTTTIDTIDFEL